MRKSVVARAGDRCEYCHLPTTGQVATFPIDHLTPRDQGGTTTLDNLAMACPRCNGHKWKHSDGSDPASGQTCRLFHPRNDDWADHFRWSGTEVGVLEGTTAIGRATIARLQINHPHHLTIRKLLASLGLFLDLAPASSD
ncbi:MAG: HNH endonuclease signature motif containing protein [Gemmataceae bacterium]